MCDNLTSFSSLNKAVNLFYHIKRFQFNHCASKRSFVRPPYTASAYGEAFDDFTAKHLR